MKLLKWISVADRFTKVYLDNQFAPLGINSSQHMYLLKICENPGILQDSLLESFYVHPSNVVRTVLALEKKGFLTRTLYEKDKRTCRLYPTEKALAIAGQVQEICDRTESMLMEEIGEDEQKIFADVLIRAGKQIAGKLDVERKGDEFDE